MKKITYALILPLVVVGGLVFANMVVKNHPAEKIIRKPASASEREVELKRWKASPDGVKYEKWKASPNGKKVFSSAAKISKEVKNFTDMEAVVTSLSLPTGSALGFGMMVKINGEEFILCFRSNEPNKNFLIYNDEFKHLYGLKVNDKIMIRSRNIMHAPKYSYPILFGDLVKFDNKVIYQHKSSEDGC
ncbi:hypothetical protein [Nubsella zeaxanthinifaciens]|uniref:hypothetical protein n=1 Tax=Nubsella zeaxanthinifaciens TaxID=392412 RepID=UPI000DE52267|nr:hypothetical protein [Nubsella zeaxanthinifaciens]